MIANVLAHALSRRSHPASPSDQILYALTGYTQSTKTGLIISESEALNYGAVFACIRVLAESVSQLPLHIYKRLPNGGKKPAVNHLLYNILHIQPNPIMTSMVFREVQMHHILSWGNSYAGIERDNGGRIIALWPLRPDRMNVRKNPNNANELQYIYSTPNGSQITISAADMLHVPGLGFDGLVGYSPLSKMRECIGLGLGAEEYAARYFANGARPPLVVTHPGPVSSGARKNFIEQWQSAYGGVGNAHKTALLEEAMDVKQIGFNPQDSQMLETRKFQNEEIARYYRVPLHMIQSLDRATNNNIEQQSIDFVTHSLMPWLKRYEENYTTQLIKDKKYFAEHLVAGLIRGDLETRYRSYAIARQNGWLSANDIRRFENMNPISKEEGGDMYLVPLNLTDMALAGEIQSQLGGTKPPPLESDSRQLRLAKNNVIESRNRIIKQYYGLFESAAQRIIDKETKAIKRNAKKHLSQRNLQSFQDWMETFYRDLPSDIKKALGGVLEVYADVIKEQIGKEINVEDLPELAEFSSQYLDKYTKRHISSSLGQLQQILRDNDVEERQELIEQRANEWAETRADKIAHRETNQMMNGLAATILITMGYRRVWRAQGKSCPYCLALDGKVIEGANDTFVQKGDFNPEGAEKPMRIYGMRRNPPLHGGCDCFVTAE